MSGNKEYHICSPMKRLTIIFENIFYNNPDIVFIQEVD